MLLILHEEVVVLLQQKTICLDMSVTTKTRSVLIIKQDVKAADFGGTVATSSLTIHSMQLDKPDYLLNLHQWSSSL